MACRLTPLTYNYKVNVVDDATQTTGTCARGVWTGAVNNQQVTTECKILGPVASATDPFEVRVRLTSGAVLKGRVMSVGVMGESDYRNLASDTSVCDGHASRVVVDEVAEQLQVYVPV